MTTPKSDYSRQGGALLVLPQVATRPAAPGRVRHGGRADRPPPRGSDGPRLVPASSELGGLLASVNDLLARHLRLAHLELQDDARWIGRRLVLILALAPLVLVGFSFLCATGAFELARVSSWPFALAVIGLLNLLVGGTGIAIAAQQIARRQILAQTIFELEPSWAHDPRQQF